MLQDGDERGRTNIDLTLLDTFSRQGVFTVEGEFQVSLFDNLEELGSVIMEFFGGVHILVENRTADCRQTTSDDGSDRLGERREADQKTDL